MVPRMFTTASWLASLLRRSVAKGHSPNVALVEDGAKTTIQLEDGEQLIAVIQTADGREYVFSDRRAAESDVTLFRYDEIVRCHWITDHPDPRESTRLKRTHFHRLILKLSDGRRVVLEQLGQAVFPLLRFFGSIVPALPADVSS